MCYLDIFVGVGFVALIWLINTFIAFVPFNRKTKTSLVIITWIIIDTLIFFLFFENIYPLNLIVKISIRTTIITLAILYLIPISSKFPKEALVLSKKLSKKHKDKYKYAKTLFLMLEKRWTSPTRQYLLEPHKVFFIKSAKKIWKKGYNPSNIQAQFYRKLLIQSKRFNKKNCLFKQGGCANSPHGYILIKHPKQNIYADLWAADNFKNYKFGQYAKAPCDKLTGKEFK